MKQKRGEMAMGSLASVLIVLLILVVMGVILFSFKNVAEAETNVGAVESWVLMKAEEQDWKLGLANTETPPVPYLVEPLEVDSEAELHNDVIPYVAETAFDCARAFTYGEKDFMGAFDSNTFCFQCGVVKFSPAIKEKGYLLGSIRKYLEDTKAYSTGGSYTDFLQQKTLNDKLFLSFEQTADDQLVIKDDIYIYAIGVKKMVWSKAIDDLISPGYVEGGALIAAPLAIYALTPLGWVTAASLTVGGVVAVKVSSATIASQEYKLWIYTGTQKNINVICNMKVDIEDVTKNNV